MTGLTAALTELADTNEMWPCANDPAFTADDAATREKAAEKCTGCPIRDLCYMEGFSQFHGVWGGVDRSRSASTLSRRKSRAAIREAFRENLLEMAATGRSWHRAAQDMGVSTETLQRRCIRAGFADEIRDAFGGWPQVVDERRQRRAA